jgi:hypothetical protein
MWQYLRYSLLKHSKNKRRAACGSIFATRYWNRRAQANKQTDKLLPRLSRSKRKIPSTQSFKSQNQVISSKESTGLGSSHPAKDRHRWNLDGEKVAQSNHAILQTRPLLVPFSFFASDHKYHPCPQQLVSNCNNSMNRSAIYKEWTSTTSKRKQHSVWRQYSWLGEAKEIQGETIHQKATNYPIGWF